MSNHERINYLEFHAHDLSATKAFFETVFGWVFTDYGPDYTAFSENSAPDAGLDGGFFRSEQSSRADNGAALTVFYSSNLESTLAKVEAAGGEILKPIFEFPGGRRFHFAEPSGNEFAVWGDPVSE